MTVATATRPANITATGVELFKVGQQTDSKGRSKAWTTQDLDQIAASYNSVVSKLHDAPVLDEPAAKVQVSHGDKERAYGWLARAYRDGDTLKGDYAHVDPAFAEMVNAKQYRKRSISLYPPDHPSNPTPGEWNIRHVAYVAIPAVKGLADHAIPVAFSDDGEDTWEFAEEFDFALPMAMSAFGAIAALFQSLREKAIEKEGLDKADAAYPSTLIEQVRGLDNQEFVSMSIFQDMAQDLFRQIDDLRKTFCAMQERGMSFSDFADWKKMADDAGMDIAAVSKATKIPPPVVAAIMSGETEPDDTQTAALEKALGSKKKEKPVDMTELQAQVTQLQSELAGSKTAIAALQAENKRLGHEKETARINNFVERLITERKVLPANRNSIVELALAMPHETPIEFTEGDAKVSLTPRDRYLAELDKNKPLYSNSSLPTGPGDAPYNHGEASNFAAAPGFSVDADAQVIHNKAVAYCEEKGWDHRDSGQYVQAVVAVSQ